MAVIAEEMAKAVVAAEVVVHKLNLVNERREQFCSLLFIFLLLKRNNYLLLKKEIAAPNNPMKARPKITKPIGIFGNELILVSYVGMTKGGGGVKVGSWVGFPVAAKAAIKVGSMTCVTLGVDVGGGSIIGRYPGESTTSGAYTHPTLPGTPR